jgi:hypothetical protein
VSPGEARLERSVRGPELPRLLGAELPARDERTIWSERPHPRPINEDPAYRELERADRAVAKALKYLSSEVGADSDCVAFIHQARSDLYEAQQFYARETRPRATSFVHAAVARAASRRSA